MIEPGEELRKALLNRIQRMLTRAVESPLNSRVKKVHDVEIKGITYRVLYNKERKAVLIMGTQRA